MVVGHQEEIACHGGGPSTQAGGQRQVNIGEQKILPYVNSSRINTNKETFCSKLRFTVIDTQYEHVIVDACPFWVQMIRSTLLCQENIHEKSKLEQPGR